MPTRQEQIFRMRSGLDNPYPSNPSFHQLLQQEISEEMDILNATIQSAQPWATNTYTLNYNPNQDTYIISVSDWGKVLYVVRLFSNPYIQACNVEFDDLNNQHYGVTWQNWYGTFAYPWNTVPERMSFSREGVLDADIKVTIQPMPQESCIYEICYIPGFLGNDDPLESSIQLPAQATLAQLRGQMALLPMSRWFENEEQNMAKRKELAQSYAYQLSRKEPIFENYIRNINIPKTTTLEDWNC